MIWTILAALAAGLLGIALGAVIRKKIAEGKIISAEKESARLLAEAEATAAQRRKEADLEVQALKLKSQKEVVEDSRSLKAELEKI